MKIKLLIDMNLSPLWANSFKEFGIEAYHWSSIGLAYDPDSKLFEYAQEHDLIIFTHDLDFGTILATTNASTPSVIQLRDEDVFPNQVNSSLLFNVLVQFEDELLNGALITINKQRTKIRLLPIKQL
jgi:predicted nuclease of predicted toxin-antitoxin system